MKKLKRPEHYKSIIIILFLVIIFIHTFMDAIYLTVGKIDWAEYVTDGIVFFFIALIVSLVAYFTLKRILVSYWKAEERYRILTEMAPDSIWTTDMDLNWTYVSPAVFAQTGYTREESLQRPLEKTLMPESFELVMQTFAEELEHDKERDPERMIMLELGQHHKNGSVIWMDVSVRFLRDEKEKPISVLGVTRDVTDKRKIEKALEESERRLREITNEVKEGILLLNSNGNIVFWNQGAEEMFGYFSDEIIGNNAISVLSPEKHHSEYSEKFEDYRETGISSSESGVIEFNSMRKDRTVFPVEVSNSFIEIEGEPCIVVVVRDATERKKAEEALESSEEMFKAIADNSFFGIIVHDGTKVVYANDRIKEITGYPKEFFSGAGEIFDILLPEYHDMVGNIFMRLIQGENIKDSEYVKLKRKDGKIVEVLASLRMVNIAGTPAVLSMLLDVTDQRNAEEAVKESEAKYKFLTEKMNDIVWMTDVEMKCTYVSSSVELVLGFTPEEYLDMDIEKRITPESLKHASESMARELELAPLSDPSQPTVYEIEFYTKDGLTKWLETKITFIRDENNEPTGLHGVSRDITERLQLQKDLQKSEEKHRLLAENSTDVIWTTNLELEWTYLSPAVKRQRGFTSEEAMNQPVQDTLTPESFELAVKTFADELEHDNEKDPNRMVTLEFSEYRKGGSIIWTEATMRFLRDDDGNPTGIIGVTRDITKRKEYEKELERKNIELDGYTQMVSHDLKNPLATLHMSVELMETLLSNPLNEENTKTLKEVLKSQKGSIKTANSIINDLLILAKSSKPDKVEEVNVSKVIETVVKDFDKATKDKNAVIKFDSNLEKIIANRTHVYQIFTNLIKNSLKHGGIDNLVIEITYLKSKDGTHKYLVRDSGTGIDEEIIDKIFVPFIKSNKTGETGIGLSIVDKLVQVYGGEIKTYNDNGACFEFVLKDYQK